LLWSHGIEASFADDHTWFTGIIGHTLGVGCHVLNLLKGEIKDAYWMVTIGQRVNKGSSLSLVSDGIETHRNVLGMNTHEAVGVINDVTALVFGLEGYRLVWVSFTVDSDLVELFDQLVDHLDVRSLGSSAVESSVSVIKDDGAFSFEGFAFFLKVSEVDGVLVTFLESRDELWSSFVSPGLV
jgi:hypothetical protein